MRFPRFLLATLLVTCAARRPSMAPPAIVQTAQALGPTNRLAAVATLEEYLAADPDPAVEPWAMLNAGEQRRLAGDDAIALRWFESMQQKYPEHPLREAATLGIALTHAHGDPSGNTLATLQLVGDRGVPDTMNADRYCLLARLGADEGTPRAKVHATVDKALHYAQADADVLARIQGELADLSQEAAATRIPAPTPIDAQQAAALAVRKALAVGDLQTAQTQAQRFVDTWPDAPQVQEMRYAVRRAQLGDPVIADKVGVMLPASGTYSPVTQRLRQAIEFANARAGDHLDFVWYDTTAPGADVQKGVEDLALEQGCVAILGPLLKEGVMSAAQTAQDIGIPMVALAQAEHPTQAGDFVFRGFLPLDQQVDALLHQAMDVQGLKRFAILHPRSPYGETIRDLFVAGVQKRDGVVVHTVDYDPQATSFLEAAQALGQKDYEARASEWYRLKKAAERAHRDTDKLVLPPIVDFDAIFIPDNWRRVALVASSLAYEEFPIGDFRPDRHAARIPLYGLNGWNDPHIIEAGGQYVQDAIFVDAFLPGSSPVRDWSRAYSEEYHRSPGVVDALTFDATRLLAEAVIAGGDSRLNVREELEEVQLPNPVAGGSHFGADREVARTLQVLTIHGDRIQRWEPPEEALPPEGLPPEGAPAPTQP